MRDILFRGKRLDKKDEWVEGGIVHQTDFYGDSVDRHYIIDGTDTDDNIGPAYRVHPDTIGQYTGLTDKNCKKIFEGDIVVINTSEKRKIKKYRVEFDNGIFGIRLSTNANDNTIIPLRSFDYIEIINPSIDHLCCSQHVVTKRDIDCAPTIIKAEVSE